MVCDAPLTASTAYIGSEQIRAGENIMSALIGNIKYFKQFDNFWRYNLQDSQSRIYLSYGSFIFLFNFSVSSF